MGPVTCSVINPRTLSHRPARRFISKVKAGASETNGASETSVRSHTGLQSRLLGLGLGLALSLGITAAPVSADALQVILPHLCSAASTDSHSVQDAVSMHELQSFQMSLLSALLLYSRLPANLMLASSKTSTFIQLACLMCSTWS